MGRFMKTCIQVFLIGAIVALIISQITSCCEEVSADDTDTFIEEYESHKEEFAEIIAELEAQKIAEALETVTEVTEVTSETSSEKVEETDEIDPEKVEWYSGHIMEKVTEEAIEAEIEKDVYDIALEKYGIPEYQVTRALKLITYEAYGDDLEMDYLMACTVVNRFIKYGTDIDIYRVWGGADHGYYEWLDGVKIEPHAEQALTDALTAPIADAWYCHGLVLENGFRSGVQLLDDAIYIVELNGMWFGVWPEDSAWY